MSKPTFKDDVSKNPRKHNPYDLFLILILLILSEDVLQMLKTFISKIKTIKKKEMSTLPADKKIQIEQFKKPETKKRIIKEVKNV